MHRSRCKFAAIVVFLGFLFSVNAAFCDNSQKPKFVNWSLDGAYSLDNDCRSMIVLNGWWRWKPAKEEAAPPLVPGEKPVVPGWRYRKVPGVGINFHILDSNGNDWLKSKNYETRKALTTGACIVEREFTLPAKWKNRNIQLVFENVFGDGVIYLDGKKMGHTWPMRPHHLDLPKPYKFDKPYTLTIEGGGVVSNVWLKAFSSTEALIDDSYLMTSVRNMEATIRAAGAGEGNYSVKVVITDYKDPEKVVKTEGPFAVKAENGRWRLERSFDWKDAKLWSLESPNLYKYYIELLGDDGKVVDRILPIRFGFREVWVKGGDFMLNDRRITLNMDIHTPLATKAGWSRVWRSAGHMSRAEVWRKAFARWKKLGINTAVHRWSGNVDDTTLFRTADEEGFFISISVFGLQYGSPQFKAIPAVRKHMADLTRYLILPRRHSPCVVFYYLPGTSNTWDFEPKKLGEDYDSEKLFGRHNRPERALVHSLDPTRIAFAGSGGGKGEPVHSSMNYIHIDADMQVHETWPSHWYKKRNKPLATYEMAAPPYIADWYMRRSRGEQAHGTRGVLPFWLEVAAIYLGEEPYLIEPRENINKWLSVVGTKRPQYGAKWGVKSYEKVAKLFTRNVFRSWRTYGVNMGLFTQVRGYYTGKPFYVMPLKVDPRRPGFVPDGRISLADPFKEEPYSPVGQVAKEALSPLLAYIGGADGEFTNKDRAFAAGEKVRKAVVVLNDRDYPALVSGSWMLCDKKGVAVLKGDLPVTKFAPGELAPAKVHIEFKAPEVKERTEYTLKLMAQADAQGKLDDEFQIAVFPAPEAVKVPANMKIFLFDPVGDTQKMLEKAKVKFSLVAGTLPDPKTSLLIVGRNALKNEADRRTFGGLLYRKMGYDFGINVSNGMRVLVFEQALDNVWGLKTEQTRWRRAFIRAAGHPVLKGLGKGDFIYLRGDSNLVESYPEPGPGRAARVATDRFPEWGNDNVVTTYAITKPQLGAMRALVDCGFDLQEAALLEAAGGKGRLMFCQIDVTNRYGIDPVSTQLVNNMLTYMTTVKEPDPAVGKPVDLVREGWEDYGVNVKKEAKVFIADKPDGPMSWGISAADLYFEGYLDLPVIQGKGGKKYLYCKLPGGNKLAHVLNRRSFNTKWQKMKTMIMRAALQINQGGTSETFPNPGLQDDTEELYPLEWLEGFVHPYLMMQW